MKTFHGRSFSFLGRSGSGKGTQFDLFEEQLKRAEHVLLRHTSGDFFRELAKKDSPAGVRVREILETGGLMPGWMASYTWEKNLIERMETPETVVLFDGSPRRLEEAQRLDEVLEWLHRPLIVPVYIDVPSDEIKVRLKLRGRHDDTDKAIERRLAWFEEEVRPILDYYESEERLITIDGVGEIEEVFTRIMQALTP